MGLIISLSRPPSFEVVLLSTDPLKAPVLAPADSRQLLLLTASSSSQRGKTAWFLAVETNFPSDLHEIRLGARFRHSSGDGPKPEIRGEEMVGSGEFNFSPLMPVDQLLPHAKEAPPRAFQSAFFSG